jgi:signal transduction histidine kinase
MQLTETLRETAGKRDNPQRKRVSLDRAPVRLDDAPVRPNRNQVSLNLKPNRDLKSKRADGKQNISGLKQAVTAADSLPTLNSRGESLAEAAHDARNMVTALGLYCDLLEEPGVLATAFVHYGHELRLVAAASRRLVEKIVAIDMQRDSLAAAGTATAAIPISEIAIPGVAVSGDAIHGVPIPGVPIVDRRSGEDDRRSANGSSARTDPSQRWDLLPAVPVANLAVELLANRNLLAALAGPAIAFTVHAEGGAGPVRLTGEDLTRVLVNLVKNSTEALRSGGRIHIGLREEPPAQGVAACLLLTVEDNGPGIPADALETIFTSGYTSHGMSEGTSDGKSAGSNGICAHSHRGLGLTITRSIVEGSGGRITACNREEGGARFRLELPLRTAAAQAD